MDTMDKEKIYADAAAAEAGFDAAVAKRDSARGPVGRFMGHLSVWQARGNLEDSAQHLDMVDALLAEEARQRTIGLPVTE
jgi:hypothetical protein